MTGPVLEFKSVRAGYGPVPVFDNCSFTLAPSEGACLAGSNGCGKSTVLRCVVGLAEIQAGTVKLLGEEAHATPPHVLAASGVGYVPQGRGDFPSLTVEENLHLAAMANRDVPTSETIERVMAKFPFLAPLRTRKVRYLSGGERTMVALARALAVAKRPRLLLLDEVSAGLSASNLEFAVVLLSRMRESGTSILAAEQNIGFAQSLKLPFVEPTWCNQINRHENWQGDIS